MKHNYRVTMHSENEVFAGVWYVCEESEAAAIAHAKRIAAACNWHTPPEAYWLADDETPVVVDDDPVEL
jgi:hypothetical protein